MIEESKELKAPVINKDDFLVIDEAPEAPAVENQSSEVKSCKRSMSVAEYEMVSRESAPLENQFKDV